jgi:hypothetical protein
VTTSQRVRRVERSTRDMVNRNPRPIENNHNHVAYKGLSFKCLRGRNTRLKQHHTMRYRKVGESHVTKTTVSTRVRIGRYSSFKYSMREKPTIVISEGQGKATPQNSETNLWWRWLHKLRFATYRYLLSILRTVGKASRGGDHGMMSWCIMRAMGVHTV